MLAAQRNGLPSVTHTEPAQTACGLLAPGPCPDPAPCFPSQSLTCSVQNQTQYSTLFHPRDSGPNGSASQASVAYRTPPRPGSSGPDLIR